METTMRRGAATWLGATCVLLACAGPAAAAVAPCAPGYLPRGAVPGDVVCVARGRRDEVQRENALATQRIDPHGGAYGPNTCRQGYVWRVVTPSDRVCVRPSSRSLVAFENATASSRQLRPPCASRAECAARADESARQAAALRQLIAQRNADLAAAQAANARAEARQRAEDEAWSRAHPGLGRTTEPMTQDNIMPIQNDIDMLQRMLADQQRQQAAASAAAASATR
jgi:hypothetical protein